MKYPLPHFNEGDGANAISASAMNRIVDAIKESDRRLVELERRTIPDHSFEQRTIRDATVVIVAKPVASSRTLRVRKVRYRDNPPRPCEGSGDSMTCFYDFASPAFDAYPDFGKSPLDYDGEEVSEAQPLGSDTPFFRAFNVERQWIVERVKAADGTGIKPAVVLAASGTGSTITVHALKKGVDVAGHIDWILDPSPEWPRIVPLWGDQNASDFATFLPSFGVPQNRPRDTIPILQLDGEWFAMQYVWFQTGTPNAQTPRGDCV